MTRASLVVAMTMLIIAPASAQTTPAPDGWVVIPVDDYRALRAKAFPPDRDPEPPPADATVTRLDYDLRATADAGAMTSIVIATTRLARVMAASVGPLSVPRRYTIPALITCCNPMSGHM